MWKRTDHLHKGDQWGFDPEQDRVLAHRGFGEEGKAYPRISIAIYRGLRDTGSDTTLKAIRISVSEKKTLCSWWSEPYDGLPLELIPELIEVLQEVQAKIEKGDT